MLYIFFMKLCINILQHNKLPIQLYLLNIFFLCLKQAIDLKSNIKHFILRTMLGLLLLIIGILSCKIVSKLNYS